MDRHTGQRDRRAGTTMTELIVSMCLFELLGVMLLAIISPASKLFVRMQRVLIAQSVTDNVTKEITSQLQNAAKTIHIYQTPADGSVAEPLTAAGGQSGPLLEYLNTEDYVVLLSADGCGETSLFRGNTAAGTVDAVDGGQLLMRYYWPTFAAAGSDYQYTYKQDGTLSARSVNPVFPKKYYMGMYLDVSFSYPDGVAVGDQVSYLNVKVTLYEDETKAKLLSEEETVVRLRYQVKRSPDALRTAVEKTTTGP